MENEVDYVENVLDKCMPNNINAEDKVRQILGN